MLEDLPIYRTILDTTLGPNPLQGSDPNPLEGSIPIGSRNLLRMVLEVSTYFQRMVERGVKGHPIRMVLDP